MELLDSAVVEVHQEQPVQLDRRACREDPDTRVPLEVRERLDCPATREAQDLLVSPDRPVTLDRKVTRARPACRVLLVCKDPPDRRAAREQPEIREPRDFKVELAILDSRVQLAAWGSWEPSESAVPLEAKDFRELPA